MSIGEPVMGCRLVSHRQRPAIRDRGLVDAVQDGDTACAAAIARRLQSGPLP